ncbi:hypothetical protein AtNW77_Chr1g0042771 [Arabidopsis thaliana]
MESNPADDVIAEVSNKKQRTEKAHIKVDEEEKTNLLDIWNMLEKMNVTISDMDKNASRRLDGLEKKVACLEESSWVVEEKLGSVDGLPIQRVVKKAVNSLKKKEAATKVLTKKKVAKSNKKKTIVNVEKVEKPKPEMKKTIVKVEKVDSPKPEEKK